MIPLQKFNAAKVLEGAHLQIVCESDPDNRFDWAGDRLHISAIDLAASPYDRHVLTPDRMDWSCFSLDPTEPDTARLIDRRIAEAIFADQCVPVVAVLAPLSPEGRAWHLSILDADGMTWARVLTSRAVGPYPFLGSLLPATEANLPEARHRLLIALYPPEVK